MKEDVAKSTGICPVDAVFVFVKDEVFTLPVAT